MDALLNLEVCESIDIQDPQQLRDRVAFIHDQVGTDALVEEYVDGREVYVGVLGNNRLRVREERRDNR